MKDKYVLGQKWGEKIASQIFKSKDRKKIKSLVNARFTCSKYANNKNVLQTNNGEFLTKSDRKFYRGASDGITLIMKKYM